MENTVVLSETAQKNVDRWLSQSYDEGTKQYIRILKEKNEQKLEDCFYTTLSFGTAGIRGVMDIGTNRINAYMVREWTQGLVNHILHSNVKKPKLVIGYDTRNNSRFFAEQAACTAASNGIETFLFDTCCPTPLLSFAVRKLACQAGIMITASHNPPEYNGYKVYWSDGAQVVAPHDKAIAQEIERVHQEGFSAVHFHDKAQYTFVGRDIISAYLQEIKKLMLWPESESKNGLKVLYTSLHGTGGVVMEEAFRLWGIEQVGLVHAQMAMDGNFPTAKKPNPELPEALALGSEKLIKENYDLLLATDPDADRVGVVVRHKGKAVTLTGNQIGSLMAEWIVRRLYEEGRLPPKPALVKSIVTTPLIQHIAKYWNVACFDVLTGFKYIAELIRNWEDTPSEAYSFLFGAEESLGFLCGTNSRDKDGILSSCIIAEIASHFKKEGKTLVDALHELWKKYGVFVEGVKTISFPETKEGKASMVQAMEWLRKQPPASLNGWKVVAFEDLLNRVFQGDHSRMLGLNLAKSDVLLFHLEGEKMVAIRPSGTEPKVKVYGMVADGEKGRTKKEDHILEKQLQLLFQNVMGLLK